LETKLAPSVIVKAKQSVDETVESYLGRAGLFVCVLAAAGFALSGLWLMFREWFGPIVACFILAAIFAGLSAAIQSVIVSRDRRAESALSSVTENLTEAAAATVPTDLKSLLAYAPAIMPIIIRFRALLPIVALAALAFVFWPKPDEQPRKV
jgi:hypothetical protein